MNFSIRALQLLSIFKEPNRPTPEGILRTKTSRDQLDLRQTGFVGPVHNQGGCNACWAFSAAGSIEYHVGKQVSVQNILDCSPDTYGCRGGLMGHVFEYYDAFPFEIRVRWRKTQVLSAPQGRARERIILLWKQILRTISHSCLLNLDRWLSALIFTGCKNTEGTLSNRATAAKMPITRR